MLQGRGAGFPQTHVDPTSHSPSLRSQSIPSPLLWTPITLLHVKRPGKCLEQTNPLPPAPPNPTKEVFRFDNTAERTLGLK